MKALEFILQHRVWVLAVVGGLIIAAAMRRMSATVPPELVADAKAASRYRRGYTHGVRSVGVMLFVLLVVMLVVADWLLSG